MITTVITVATGDISPVWDIAEQTWRPYCHRHGYLLKVVRELPIPSLHPSWNKVKAVLDEIQCATGPVWCVDADMTIAKPELPLERDGLNGKPAWFSSDWNGLCAALFRMLPGSWTEWFLNTALFCRDVGNPDQFGKGLGCKWEQNAFKVLIREFPAISAKVGLLPAQMVTDRPPSDAAMIYHFGARSNSDRIMQMKKLHNIQ